MSYWGGFVEGINERRISELDRQRKEQDAQREVESKIAMRLLEDDDPDLQMHGMSLLQQALTPSKQKKGLKGFMGNLEDRQGLSSILDFGRSQAGQPGQLQQPPAQPDSAALPQGSPASATTPGPSMLQKAVQGGAKFGATTPPPTEISDVSGATFGQGGAAAAPEVPGQASFGGIQFGEPGMGNPNAQPPAVNIAKIAGRVSQDKGQPQPGERARLFFPSAARLNAQKITSEFQAYAAQLQALGATPNETKRALMSKMGASGGQPNVTSAGYAKLADGRAVQTFTYEEAGMAPRLVMAGPDGGFVPVPPDAQATRMGAGATGSQTSRMSVKQAFDYGIIEQEDIEALGGLNSFISVKQVGDTMQILPATKPSEPFGFQRGPGFAQGVDRNGNPVDLPQQQLNPKVAAAKALVAAYRAIPSLGRTTQGQRTRSMQGLMQQYPILQGLTPAQIESLAQADDYLPNDQVEGLIRSTAKPQSMATPQGSNDPNILPPDWADRLAKEILNQQGRTMTPPPR